MVPLPAAGQAGTHAAIHSPSPLPAAVVTAGPVTVGVTVPGGGDVRLEFDGRDLAVELRETPAGIRATATTTVPEGGHTVRATARSAGGETAARTWEFTATARTTGRFGGATRIDTAVLLSRAGFPRAGTAPAAVLARADEFADALAGVPLAAALDAPLLLTERTDLTAAVAAELQRAVAHDGAVHLLGGAAALAPEVATDVADLGFEVVRHGGTDRYATAADVAAALPPADTAVVASGTSFPDALSVSAAAARVGAPVLLTRADRLPDATADALARRGPERVFAVGGTAVVGERVEAELRRHIRDVERIAGPDRYATAAAVMTRFFDDPTAISLASGTAFPDALSGARHAAAGGRPLLLTAPTGLPAASDTALRAARPDRIDVYGGSGAVAADVEAAALLAAVDGPGTPRVTSIAPAAATTVAALDEVVVAFDRPVDPARSTLALAVGGLEVPVTVRETEPSTTLTARLDPDAWQRPVEEATAALVTVAARPPAEATVETGGTGAGHGVRTFTYLEPHPVFATVGGVEVHRPSREIELVGFHESSHDGARQLTVRDTSTPTMTLPSRYRRTGSRTAADAVAAPHREVLAPVTGTVVRAGSYVLYCRYSDHYLVIEPDAHPGWEVKLLHFRGLQVAAGDRVEASTTVVGTAPRTLPFESQVDDYSQPRNWPHVHVEVVDPSIPDRSGGSC